MREEELTQVRVRTTVGDHLFCLWVLLLLLVLILSLRKLQGFLLYGFPKENSLCLLSLVNIVVHVFLSDNILRSYCLNDKNLTNLYWYVFRYHSPVLVSEKLLFKAYIVNYPFDEVDIQNETKFRDQMSAKFRGRLMKNNAERI